MKRAFLAYQAGKITRKELYRYQALTKKYFGNGESFVVISDNEDRIELNKITIKVIG